MPQRHRKIRRAIAASMPVCQQQDVAMTIRNLDKAFHPRSVAIIGASQRAGSVGQVVLRNIIAAGFGGVAVLALLLQLRKSRLLWSDSDNA